ncbi:MAG TPA: ankyrin repeat domain-containing protein [Gemmatimonadaceae bacterium]|nr:ankyrin repeat domain-containing protein [Gemmatimonadaceae bacterium]
MTRDNETARDRFIEAAFWHGPLDRAQAILAEHPEIAGSDIHAAAVLGDDSAIRRFLSGDTSLASSRGGPRNVEPLVHLCFSRYLALDRSRSEAFVRAASALLDAGANANAGFFDDSHVPRPEWESALYGAAGVAHHAGVTRLLLEHGANPNDEEVPYHSPETWENDAFRLLLESGKLNEESLNMMLLRKTDWHDLEGVRLVLDHGADVNRMTRWGKTALHNAVLSDNRLAIIELLLDRGADATIVARDLRHGGEFRIGRSSISLAARRGRADVLEAMEKRGVALAFEGVDELIGVCARGDAAAALGIATRDPELVAKLASEGGTLLAEFSGTGNAAGVRLLLDLGVPVGALYTGDPYFGIARDSTALHVAAWRAAHEVVELLIARGASVDARDGKDRTPLMLAIKACVDSYWAERRSPRSVRALLAAGARTTGVAYPSGYAEVDALLEPYVG